MNPGRAARSLHRDGRGSASVLVALFLLGLVAVSGLVADGGRVLAERRQLQNLADSAAAAGAMQLDVAAYRRAGARVSLDEAGARRAAEARLASASGLSARVLATSELVSVRVERSVPLAFLGLLGLGGVTVSASAEAEPRAGVGAPS